MDTFRFRDWEVYRNARDLRRRLLSVARTFLPSYERFELASQLRRALSSIILNIAEGAYRSSDRDFAVFLNRAGASAYEVVALLDLFVDEEYLTEGDATAWRKEVDAVVRQLGALQKHVLRASSSS